jgi:hypothetical protein
MSEMPRIISFEEFEAETLPIIRPPFRSRFGAVPWPERHTPRASKHEWLVKNVITRGEQAMLVGASQSGKSFLAIDLAMSIARGTPWFGNKTRQGLVIYQAGESAKGVRDKRIPAYERHHGLWNDTDLPFVLLTLPIDLFRSDDDCEALIAECRHWQEVYPAFQLELLTIDTFSAATPGADENGSRDVSGIRRRCKRLELELGCTVLLVHHKNAAGTKARGHTSMFADVENVLDVSLVETEHGKNSVPLKDANGRKVREAVVAKLKDGEDGKRFRFVLPAVKLGVDEDGDDITSCIIQEPDMGMLAQDADRERPQAAKRLSTQIYNYLIALRDALAEHGEMPPPELRLPSSVRVVGKDRVAALFASRSFAEGDDPEKRNNAIRQARKRAGEDLLAKKLIGSHDPYLWLTPAGERISAPKGRSPDREQAREADPVTQDGENVTEQDPRW